MIERTEINEGSTLQTVRIYEKDPVLEFYLFKDNYVVDWSSNISQAKFITVLKGLNYTIDTPIINQSKKKYPQKIKIFGIKNEVHYLAVEGGDRDKIHYLSIEGKGYAIVYIKDKRKKKRLEFASEKKNIDTLVYLLNNTSRKKLGDKIKPDLEKVLEGYEE